MVERIIEDVSALIEAYCGRQFKSRDYTNEDHDGNGLTLVYPNHFPIISVDSVYDDVNRAFESASLIDAADYVFYEDEGRIQLVGGSTGVALTSTGFTKGFRNIRINYTAGYAVIPFDLRMIATEILVKKYKTYENRTVGHLNVNVGNQTIGLTLSDILPEHKAILDANYRSRNVISK